MLHEQAGLRVALNNKEKEKRKKHSKALGFEQIKLTDVGALFYSSSAIRVAEELARIKRGREKRKTTPKALQKERKFEVRLLKQLEKERKKHKKKYRAMVVREKERAEKAAQPAAQKTKRISTTSSYFM